MSRRIACPQCGAPMYVPAYEGDGVYETHVCRDEQASRAEQHERYLDAGPQAWDDESRP